MLLFFQIAEKLEISSITIRDLEDRINAIGKIDKGESEKKRFDGVLNQLNAEHKQQIMNMQNQLDNISVKLVCKVRYVTLRLAIMR